VAAPLAQRASDAAAPIVAAEKAAAVTMEDIKTTAVIMVAIMEDITAATMVAAMADMMAEAEAIAAAGIAAEAEDTDVEAVVVAEAAVEEEEVTSPPRPPPAVGRVRPAPLQP